MNHSSHILDQYERTYIPNAGKLGMVIDDLGLRWTFDAVKNSVKFLLPQDGDVGCSAFESRNADLVRLPYPSIMFEFSMNPQGSMRPGQALCLQRAVMLMDGPTMKSLVGLVQDFIKMTGGDAEADYQWDNPRIIYAMTFARLDENGQWPPALAILQIDLDTFFVDNGQIQLRSLPILPSAIASLAEAMGCSYDKALQEVIHDSGDELRVAMNALTCLNARNVTTLTLPPPEKLNKKRIRNGRIPFFTYHVLDIFLAPEMRKSLRVDPDSARRTIVSKLTTTALHTVRGHFKRRKTGLFWWSPFVRGHKENGVVEKDYNVRAD